jgi:hypothetical protein
MMRLTHAFASKLAPTVFVVQAERGSCRNRTSRPLYDLPTRSVRPSVVTKGACSMSEDNR